MTMKTVLAGSAIGLGVTLAATPAAAQYRCDLNGVAGVPLAAQGDRSLVCGANVTAAGPANDLATLGEDIAFSGDSVTAVGAVSIADSNFGVGGFANYERPESGGATAIGAYSIANGEGSVAIGDQATVGNIDFSLASYLPIEAVRGGTAVGSASSVTGNLGTAIGFVSQSNGFGSTAVGAGSNADANSATAVGLAAQALGDGSTSLGSFALARGDGGLAVGAAANASATGGSSYLPTVPAANLIGAMAVGTLSQAFGGDSTALGNYALIGNYNDPTTVFNGATAIGAASRVGASNATTIGARSTATGANSVALGYGSVANQANTVSVGTVGGERKVVNVAAGTAATDAVNVSQLTTATAGIATSIAAINSSILGLQGDVSNLYELRREDRKDARQGIAAAVAMADAPLPSRPGGVSYVINGATFRGEYALGGSMMYRLNTESPLAVGLGVSSGGNKNTAVKVGIAGEF